MIVLPGYGVLLSLPVSYPGDVSEKRALAARAFGRIISYVLDLH